MASQMPFGQAEAQSGHQAQVGRRGFARSGPAGWRTGNSGHQAGKRRRSSVLPGKNLQRNRGRHHVSSGKENRAKIPGEASEATEPSPGLGPIGGPEWPVEVEPKSSKKGECYMKTQKQLAAVLMAVVIGVMARAISPWAKIIRLLQADWTCPKKWTRFLARK